MKSDSAKAANMIKKILTKAFPDTKFSVKSERYSMGSSVDVYWIDGPTDDQVDKIAKDFQYGHFNGMEDIYEYSNSREDIPQAKYVMCHREISDDIMLKTAQVAQQNYADLEKVDAPKTKDDLSKSFSAFGNYWNWSQLAWKILNKIDLTKKTGVKHDENFLYFHLNHPPSLSFPRILFLFHPRNSLLEHHGKHCSTLHHFQAEHLHLD